MKRELIITVIDEEVELLDMVEVAETLVSTAIYLGGSAYAKHVEGCGYRGITVRVHGLSRTAMRGIVDCHRNHYSYLNQKYVPATPLPDFNISIPWGSIICDGLSETVVHNLPEGCEMALVARNSGEKFHEVLGPPSSRNALWERALEAGADDKDFNIWWTPSPIYPGPRFCDLSQ